MPISSIKRILIVEDDASLRATIRNYFKKHNWIVDEAQDGRYAIQILQAKLPDVILMDIKMPRRDGIETCKIIKNNATIPTNCPIILMTGESARSLIVKAIQSGCDDVIIKPFKFDALMDKIVRLVTFYESRKRNEAAKKETFTQEDVEAEVIVYSRQVIEKVFKDAFEDKEIEYPAVEEVVTKMVDILHVEKTLPMAFKMKSYNDYTYIHSVNVASIAMSFAYHLDWDDKDLQLLGEGAFMHDIGKTGVDISILMKPEKLTDEEFTIMKTHPELGKKLLEEQDVPLEVQQIVMEHHERIDGSGYPYQLTGDQMSKFGKLCGIIDAYDALTTDRCYHKGLDSSEAVGIMINHDSGPMDPDLITKFAKLVKGEIIGK